MELLKVNGKTFTGEVSDPFRGLKIKKVTLDYIDVNNLLTMNEENLRNFLKTLAVCTVTPLFETDLKPVDKENKKLQRAGMPYLCLAEATNYHTK